MTRFTAAEYDNILAPIFTRYRLARSMRRAFVNLFTGAPDADMAYRRITKGGLTSCLNECRREAGRASLALYIAGH
jgi:hypothetical protein